MSDQSDILKPTIGEWKTENRERLIEQFTAEFGRQTQEWPDFVEQEYDKEINMKPSPEPLTVTHNGEPATIDLERFKAQPQFKPQTQKEKHMKHGEIGAPRNTGDVGVGALPEVGSVKVVILNGSRQIDKVVPGVGANGAAGWQTQQVLGENGLKKGIYQLNGAIDASKKVHPQQFSGQVLHRG